MSFLDLTFGSQLVGSWVNTMMYMLVIVQALSVWSDQGRRRHKLQTKTLISTVLIVDTVGTCASCAQVYFNCVTYWGNFEMHGPPWLYPLTIAATGLNAAIVHVFLLRRLWKLSGNLLVLFVLSAVAILSLVGAIYTATVLIVFPSIFDSARWFTPTQLWIASSVSADVGLAIALAWKLYSVRTQTSYQATQSLLSRLIIISIETGGLTSALFIVTLALFVHPGLDGSIAVAFEFFVGRAYSNTLMYNLDLHRRVWSTTSGVRTSGMRSTAIAGDRNHAEINLGDIQVRTNVHVKSDNHAAGPRSSSEIEDGKPPTGSSLFPAASAS